MLGARVEQRRRLERFIDPGDQVAIDEQLLAQQSGEIGQTPAKASGQLQVLEHEQRDQSGISAENREERIKDWLGNAQSMRTSECFRVHESHYSLPGWRKFH